MRVTGTPSPWDYQANAQALPVEGMEGVDLSEISPGGGEGPEGYDWTAMNPGELMIPKIKLIVPVVARGIIPDGSGGRTMDLPVSFQAAWLRESAEITAENGTTVIAGHVNWSDGSWAPMSNLYNASPGMKVYLTSREGDLTVWRVTKTDEFQQSELSEKISVIDTDGPRRLVLITCKSVTNPDGSLSFTKNWVVTAEPVQP